MIALGVRFKASLKFREDGGDDVLSFFGVIPPLFPHDLEEEDEPNERLVFNGRLLPRLDVSSVSDSESLSNTTSGIDELLPPPTTLRASALVGDRFVARMFFWYLFIISCIVRGNQTLVRLQTYWRFPQPRNLIPDTLLEIPVGGIETAGIDRAFIQATAI